MRFSRRAAHQSSRQPSPGARALPTAQSLSNQALGIARTGLRRVNDRHPWNHNDHFHGWIVRNLPARRTAALDVGCGEGGLLARLAPYFAEVTGLDVDADMRQASQHIADAHSNVTVTPKAFAELDRPYDLITMIASLHHLDLDSTLETVTRLLRPEGRLLVVGLAPLATPVDYAWGIYSMTTNPLIGFVKHPRRVPNPPAPPAFPVRDPVHSVGELQARCAHVLPGVQFRRREGFRFTARWQAPR